MPLPRKSMIVGKVSTKKKPATRRKATTATRAKRGELLLVTCGPSMNDDIVRSNDHIYT